MAMVKYRNLVENISQELKKKKKKLQKFRKMTSDAAKFIGKQGY